MVKYTHLKERKKKNMDKIRIIFYVLLVTAAFSASADITTVYLKDSANYNAGGFAGGTWTDADGNIVAITDQTQFDFVVRNGKYFSPKSSEVITAHKITLGVVGGTKGLVKYRVSATFNCAEGVVLANGRIYNDVSGVKEIAGKVTVTSPSSAPFLLDANTSISAAAGFSFPGAFYGAATAGVRINNPSAYDYGVTIADASQYYGGIEVTSTNGSGVASGTARLVMTTLSAGSASFAECCAFELTSSAQAVVTNLTMLGGSTLKFTLPASPNATPFLTVASSLACDGDVTLKFDTSAFSLPVSAPVTYPFLKVPAASADVAASLRLDTTAYTTSRPIISQESDPVTGDVTFSVSFYPRVTSLSSDGTSTAMSLDADAPSSMTNAAAWSDTREVHSGAHYTFNIKNANIRTPWYPEGSFEFLGASLTLGAGNSTLILACRDFTCPLLYAGNYDSLKLYVAEASDATFHGDIYVAKALNVRIYNDHRFTLDGELHGSGDLLLLSGTAASSYSGHHRGDFFLTQKSESFTGKVTLSSDSGSGRRLWSSVEPYAHIWYSAPKCFGGPLPEFAYDALKIEKMARLITTNNVVFSDTTRGLYLTNIAQLETPETDDSLTLLQPVTVNGSVYKQGAGTLAMGGELKFLDAEGALTGTPPDDASKRTLYVQGGMLKPLAADALNGLNIVFSNSVNVAGVNVTDVALGIDLDTEDADLRAYGLRNTKSLSPLSLSLAGGVTKVPVKLLSDATGGTLSGAVMTVKSEVADLTFAKLDIRKPDAFATVHMSRTVVVDAEAGTSTLVVSFKNTGFRLLIR